MAAKTIKRLPKILKINWVDTRNIKISVLFSTGEDRIIDFAHIFNAVWKITSNDPEYILTIPAEFNKVGLANNTLSWENVLLYLTGTDGKRKKVAFEVGADLLYELSESDEKLIIPIGSLLKKARLAAKLSQNTVAMLSGTSRTYITRLENGKQDVELMTLKKIVEAGLNKHLTISID